MPANSNGVRKSKQGNLTPATPSTIEFGKDDVLVITNSLSLDRLPVVSDDRKHHYLQIEGLEENDLNDFLALLQRWVAQEERLEASIQTNLERERFMRETWQGRLYRDFYARQLAEGERDTAHLQESQHRLARRYEKHFAPVRVRGIGFGDNPFNNKGGSGLSEVADQFKRAFTSRTLEDQSIHGTTIQDIGTVATLISLTGLAFKVTRGAIRYVSLKTATSTTDDVALSIADEAIPNAPARIPHGFSSADDFARFGGEIRSGLKQAGFDDVQPIFQGSSVTGKSFRTGQPFDVGRVSDFDVALASPQLLQRAKSAGIGLRSGGLRTGPLKASDLRKLGLKDLADRLSGQAGRPVNFMIFESAEAATSRAPSIIVP